MGKPLNNIQREGHISINDEIIKYKNANYKILKRYALSCP